LSEKNIPPQISELIDKALETIIDQWYQSVSEYYITTEKKAENPDIFGPEELKRFHDETGHRIKFNKSDLDFTYGLSLIDDAAEGCVLDISVNNKVPNYNYAELGRRLAIHYQANQEKPVEGFTKLFMLVFVTAGICFSALMPNVANAAHIGGLITGFSIGWALCPDDRHTKGIDG